MDPGRSGRWGGRGDRLPLRSVVKRPNKGRGGTSSLPSKPPFSTPLPRSFLYRSWGVPGPRSGRTGVGQGQPGRTTLLGNWWTGVMGGGRPSLLGLTAGDVRGAPSLTVFPSRPSQNRSVLLLPGNDPSFPSTPVSTRDPPRTGSLLLVLPSCPPLVESVPVSSCRGVVTGVCVSGPPSLRSRVKVPVVAPLSLRDVSLRWSRLPSRSRCTSRPRKVSTGLTSLQTWRWDWSVTDTDRRPFP